MKSRRWIPPKSWSPKVTRFRIRRQHIPGSIAGVAKLLLGKDDEAAAWLRRSIETNRNFTLSHFALAATLALLGRLPEARSAAQAGLAINPTFTISRFRAAVSSDHPAAVTAWDRLLG